MNRISLKHFLAAGFTFFVAAALLVSCKRTFDDPPAASAPGLVANISIKDLKAMDTLTSNVVHITQDLVIRGIVNMDDKSGNYYQQISIQDSTGGIILRLAGSNLNTSYPVGRELFINVKDLYLGEYAGLLQLGGGADSINGGVTLLSPVLQDRHIYKGALNQRLEPKLVSVTDLSTDRQDRYANTLIRLVNYQFLDYDTLNRHFPYADPGSATSRVANVACMGDPVATRMTVRTSDFANFASKTLPKGSGDLLGIYTFFRTTKQLVLRDTTDVRFTNPRCYQGSTPPPTGGGTTSNATLTLTGTSPYTIDFNGMTGTLPNGVRVGATSNATTNDTSVQLTTTPTQRYWSSPSTGGTWKSVASGKAQGLTQGSSEAEQDAATDRALGVRQTGSFGDPGAGVTFIIENTTGKTLTQMTFLLQSLDFGSSRTTTWVVEYGVGNAVPISFAPLTPTGTMTTGGSTFTNNLITVPLPAQVSNQSQKVWIRVYAKTGTTGSGNRATTGIDDVKFYWN